MAPTAALLTDLYELTMVAAYVAEGMSERPATFSLFVRTLPAQRSYLVAAGLEAVLDHLETFHFNDEDLGVLVGLGLFDRWFLDYLGQLRFRGSVRAVGEGSIIFAEEPVLEIDAPIAQGQLVETYLLNQITTATTLASKAARYRQAAGDTPVIDFGLRRAQGVDAGMAVARVARICGLAGTSNVAGGHRYGFPTSGTMAHSFVQAYEDEAEAFRVFTHHSGPATVLLVDTFDTRTGVRRAIEVAKECRARGVEVRGVRLDSGDLLALANHARVELDEAGFPEMQILASGGIDEHEIERLMSAGAPIDGFGIGSSLAVSSDAPVLDTVFKLVAFDGRPVRKTSEGKATWPGRKQVWRSQDIDVLGLADEGGPAGGEALMDEVMRDGRRTDTGQPDLAGAAARFARHWDRLALPERQLSDPVNRPLRPSAALERLTAEVDARRTRPTGEKMA
ncbi:MAG: nicotinate phosphoribosyltransferase [Actinomycetota bacterium]|nr:nicotinate phosphoribosyltransferase [Actinomycetota bacterium]